MAAILKIKDGDTEIEVYPVDGENLLTILACHCDDEQSLVGVHLDKTEVEELIEFLNKQLKGMN